MIGHDFTHLHVHTDASRLDGMSPLHRLVSTARDRGFKSLAMTDHGTLANVIAFSSVCEELGVKPIIGMEAYVGLGGERYHLTLLADGNEGFESLVRLNNAGQSSADRSRPTFPLDLLYTHHHGIVVLTGCPASPFQSLPWSDASDLLRRLKDKFDGRIYAEVMFVSSDAPWERSAQIARDFRLPPVVTNDVHFPLETDADSHQLMMRMKVSFTYESKLLYLATPDQLRERVCGMAPEHMALLEKGMSNAFRLSERLRPVVFDKTPKLPHIEMADVQLKTSAVDRFKAMTMREELPLGSLHVYGDRLMEELQIIKNLDLASYFIVLDDIVSFAKMNGIKVGPGRGSGVGSLLLYVLGVTEVDPIKYGLSFNRFLNMKRAELPDVDMDFESERRDEVLKYARERWGALPIATYSRYQHKMLVHDLCRTLRSPRDLELKAAEEGESSASFATLCERQPELGAAYKAMIGQIRHVGKHAGGVVIVREGEEIPLERVGEELAVSWTEGEHRELSKTGIVKFDLLGLTALSVLKELETTTGRIPDDPKDDDDVFRLFRYGRLTGIFQFSGSAGMIDFTKRVQPRTFEDLVAINALYRPGTLDSGATENFLEWRKTGRVLDPLIDDVITPTHGAICYQEQVMAIYQRIAGGDEMDADLARRVLSKARPGQAEWEEKFTELRRRFYVGGMNHGMARETIDAIWSELKTHSGYSFNRSHAVAYSMIAWRLAWYKYHFPVHFYAATMNHDSANWQSLIFEVRESGIDVIRPNVADSTDRFEFVPGGRILLPLTVFKGLGQKGIEEIMAKRPFSSLKDFEERVSKRGVNTTMRATLLKNGAMSPIEPFDTRTGFDFSELGFVIPTMEQLREMRVAKAEGWIAGLVWSREVRTSDHGPYRVYRLLPEGERAVWERHGPELSVGEWVKLRADKKNGRILRKMAL